MARRTKIEVAIDNAKKVMEIEGVEENSQEWNDRLSRIRENMKKIKKIVNLKTEKSNRLTAWRKLRKLNRIAKNIDTSRKEISDILKNADIKDLIQEVEDNNHIIKEKGGKVFDTSKATHFIRSYLKI